MSFLKALLCVAFGLLAATRTVSALCNVCSEISYAACRSNTTYSICFQGVTPSDTVNYCPEGTVCTDEESICLPPSDTTILGCNNSPVECNVCFEGIACASQTAFAFCDASGKKTVIASCENGLQCNIDEYRNSRKICSATCIGPPTCENTEVVTETPPEDEYKQTCAGTTVAKYYVNIKDPTCKTYVYCENLDDMVAILYTCATGYFDVTAQRCVSTLPVGCVA